MKFINDSNLYESWAKTVFRTTDIVTNAIGRGFRSVRLEIIKAFTTRGIFKLSKDADILVMNDFDLTVTKILYEYGYTNISLLVVDNSENKCLTSFIFNIKYKDKSFKKLFPDGLSFWKNIFYVQAREINDIGKHGPKKTTHTEYTIEGVKDLKFDLIIANPPYGKPGAMITDKIRSDVSYTQYINLLPANDYKRVQNLHQYVRNMEAINAGFDDAVVTTHLCEVVKDANEMAIEEFEISQYIDPQLDKYFIKNIERTLELETFDSGYHPETWDIDKTFIIGERDANHHHLPYDKTCTTYRWNVTKDLTTADLLTIMGTRKNIRMYAYTFSTATEKTNFVNFMYSCEGFRFYSKIFTAVNTDGEKTYYKWLPKVDWTRAWTVEEILADYGYTEDEIKEVMNDLNSVDEAGKPKYKYLED